MTSGERWVIISHAENTLKAFVHNQTDFESGYCMGTLYGMMYMASQLEDWKLYNALDQIEQRRRDYRHGRKVLR